MEGESSIVVVRWEALDDECAWEGVLGFNSVQCQIPLSNQLMEGPLTLIITRPTINCSMRPPKTVNEKHVPMAANVGYTNDSLIEHECGTDIRKKRVIRSYLPAAQVFRSSGLNTHMTTPAPMQL